MKCKLGDVVRITKCIGGHRFFTGELVTIEKATDSDYLARSAGGEIWWVCDREIESDKKLKIKSVVDHLLKANNTVTTLETKVAMRSKFPSEDWYQRDISKIMDDYHSEGEYNFTDNGTYRVYSFAKSAVTKNNVKPKAPSMSTKKVSRTKAIDLIQSTNGRFFGVTFTKKDGTVRNMKCKIDKDSQPSPLGYLLVNDVKEASPKSLNLQTISELRMNKTTYKVG